MLASRPAWGIVLGRLLTDCVWWFYVYWLATYLTDVHHLSLVEVGKWIGIPFLAVDFGNLAGGGLSSYLVRRGWSLNVARKIVLVLGAVGMLASVPAGFTSNAGLCLALVTIVTFSYSAWGTIMLTLPTDLFPSRQTGAVSGFSGAGAGLGGIAFSWLTGHLVDHVSYTPIFLMAGIMPIVAIVLIQLLIPQIALRENKATA